MTQVLDLAFEEIEEPLDKTGLLDLHNSSHLTQPHPIIP